MTVPVTLAPRTRALKPLRQPGARDLLPHAAAAHAAPHAVMLRGLAAGRGEGPASPTLVARTEDDFIAAVQAALAAPDGPRLLADAMQALPRDDARRLLLYPPVQRVHQLVLVEACCAEPGHPRLDPRRIASAGMVLRRPQAAAEAGPHGAGWLAWQRRDQQPVGWVPLAAHGGPHGVGEADEPDATLRPPVESTGHPHIDARLQHWLRTQSPQPLAAAPASERVVPLHPLPEPLCAALGRTLLVGYLPVATDEVVTRDDPVRGAPDAADVAALQRHFMHPLRAGGLKALPRAGERVDASWLEAVGGTGTEDGGAPSASRWMQTLMQLHLELDLAGTEPAAAPLRQAFAAYRVVRVGDAGRDAVARLSPGLLDGFVAALCRGVAAWQGTAWRAAIEAAPGVTAADLDAVSLLYRAWQSAGAPRVDLSPLPLTRAEETVLDAASRRHALSLAEAPQQQALRCIVRFLGEATLAPALPAVTAQIAAVTDDDAPATTQPGWWAPVSDAAALAFAQAAAERVRQREAVLFSGRGRRLSEPGQPMAVRCFVRLRPEAEGCPATLAWSGYSPLFTVAPWWVGGPARPRVVDLPDPFDRATLRRLRPSVGFAMPGRLGAMLTPANLDRLKDGQKPGDTSGGVGLEWICGFNIPILTLCALIVLNIFLQLLNIVFWWLPFVKICLPVPARKEGP